MDEDHVYMWLHTASIKSTDGKLGFFLVCSTSLPAGASLWSERSGTTT